MCKENSNHFQGTIGSKPISKGLDAYYYKAEGPRIPENVKVAEGKNIWAPTVNERREYVRDHKNITIDDVKLHNRNLTFDTAVEYREVLGKMTYNDAVSLLHSANYETSRKPSNRKGNNSIIIQTKDSPGGKISQIQISPTPNRHGCKYVKISTSDDGIIKIVNGSPSSYKTNASEKANLIFTKPAIYPKSATKATSKEKAIIRRIRRHKK